jgi:hypothetical protein
MNKSALKAARENLSPIQEELLCSLVGEPEELRNKLRDLKVSPERLVKWLSDPNFQAAYLMLAGRWEVLHAPSVLAAARIKAIDGSVPAMKLYLDVMKDSLTSPPDTSEGDRGGGEARTPEQILDDLGLTQEDAEDVI